MLEYDVERCTLVRQFTFTRNGYSELSPMWTRVSDEMTTAHWSGMPLVLRRREDTAATHGGADSMSESWIMVGEAYVQNIMLKATIDDILGYSHALYLLLQKL